jgi:hypothetical protein
MHWFISHKTLKRLQFWCPYMISSLSLKLHQMRKKGPSTTHGWHGSLRASTSTSWKSPLRREREREREESSSSYASKVSKAKSKMDQEEDNNSILSFLEVDQLIQLGKDSGFDDKDEGELLEATISVAKGV